MLTKRQEEILSSAIKEYSATAFPVSSKLLMSKYRLPYSSATIRNEMQFLEEAGFLVKPHVSAGRIPSDKGYRYFVDNLMENREVSRDYQKRLELELLKLKARNARMERTTAKLLSSMSHCLAISGLVDKKEFYDFGVHNLLEDSQSEDLDELSRMMAALDLIDENVDRIMKVLGSDETRVFIGKENPIKEAQNFSMIVSPYKSREGDRGLVAIIGPKRMEYKKNKGLVDLVKKFLSGGKFSGLTALIIVGTGVVIKYF